MSLHDELAQVLRQHYGSLWCPTCHPAGCRDWDTPWDVVAHQADAVIAHLALTEEWQTSGEFTNWTNATEGAAARLVERFGNRTRRRYVTSWRTDEA